MTVQELSQLGYLERLIRKQQARLEELREAADVKSPALSGMPKSPGAGDRIGEIVSEIVDRETALEESIAKYTELRNRLTEFIDRIPNARIKLIMILRFIDRKSWLDVADEAGEDETEYSVKHAVYRYLERTQ